jgi:methionyl-tRNA synthetase
MAVLTSTIVTCSKLLSPVLVESAEKVYAMFNLTEEQKSYEFTGNFCGFSGNKVEKGQPLFPRLEIAVETEYIRSLTK